MAQEDDSTGSSKGALPPHGATSRQTGVRCWLLWQVLGQVHPLVLQECSVKSPQPHTSQSCNRAW